MSPVDVARAASDLDSLQAGSPEDCRAVLDAPEEAPASPKGSAQPNNLVPIEFG
jgi:hypothetical protein